MKCIECVVYIIKEKCSRKYSRKWSWKKLRQTANFLTSSLFICGAAAGASTDGTACIFLFDSITFYIYFVNILCSKYIEVLKVLKVKIYFLTTRYSFHLKLATYKKKTANLMETTCWNVYFESFDNPNLEHWNDTKLFLLVLLFVSNIRDAVLVCTYSIYICMCILY